MCVCVHLCFFQGICEGERACGEEARILEASPTTANRERVNWVPGVDLQSGSETQSYLYTAGVNLVIYIYIIYIYIYIYSALTRV